MSYNNKNNKRTFSKFAETSAKKFCGVCQKAGKTEKEYTSHYTKSIPGPTGIVTCPTILQSSCTFCFAKGHWASEDHCPALREKKRNEKKMAYHQRKYDNEEKTNPEKHELVSRYSGYQILNEESYTESVPTQITVLAGKFSYAHMAKKEPVIVVQKEEESASMFTSLSNRKLEFLPTKAPFQMAIQMASVGNLDTSRSRWLNEEDDEDEVGSWDGEACYGEACYGEACYGEACYGDNGDNGDNGDKYENGPYDYPDYDYLVSTDAWD